MKGISTAGWRATLFLETAILALGLVVLVQGRLDATNSGKVTFINNAQAQGKVSVTIHWPIGGGKSDSCKVIGSVVHPKGTSGAEKAKQLAADIKQQCTNMGSTKQDGSTVEISSLDVNISEIDLDDDTDQEVTINPQSIDDNKKDVLCRLSGMGTGGTVLLRLEGCGAEGTVEAAGKTGAEVAQEMLRVLDMVCEAGEIHRFEDLGGGAGEIQLLNLSNEFSVVTFSPGGDSGLDWDFIVRAPGVTPPAGFQRPGDANRDGLLDLSDAVWYFGHLFLGTNADLPCDGGTASSPGPGALMLLDLNGDGGLDISDPVSALGFLFMGGRPPVLGPNCLPIAGCPDRCEP